jgi:hypothetical protein
MGVPSGLAVLRAREMRSRIGVTVFILIGAAIVCSPAALAQAAHSNSSDRFGPEVTAFVELMHHEEIELDYQVKHNEISRMEYLRSRNRIAVHRQQVLTIARETGEDRVPELHVVIAAEVDQIVDGGSGALKGVKPGTIIDGKLRYLGSVIRGEAFYTFERLTGK